MPHIKYTNAAGEVFEADFDSVTVGAVNGHPMAQGVRFTDDGIVTVHWPDPLPSPGENPFIEIDGVLHSLSAA